MDNRSETLLIFPDTNVLIQGRALHELPWEEMGSGDLEVIICGPVIRELDRLKNKGGRAGKVARTMSTTVRELMGTADKSDVLRESGPRVVRRLLLGHSVREPVRPSLDLANDDQAIINQALARADAGDDVILLTDDNFAAMTAAEYGLPVRLMPGHWLKKPEADDSGKEIARRDAEIARLKSAEPLLKLRFVDAAGAPVRRLEATIKRYLPVPDIHVDRLVDRVAKAAPRISVLPTETKPVRQRSGSFDLADFAMTGSVLPPLPITPADIDEYRAEHDGWLKSVRHKIANFHDEWNRRREWPSAQLMAANSGTRPAEDVLVEIIASGRFALSGRGRNEDQGGKVSSWLALALPPEPPRVRPRTLGSMSFNPLLGRDPLHEAARLSRPFIVPDPRQEDRFYWRDGKSEPVKTMELECKAWRHGREEEDFAFHIWALDDEPVAGLITARVSASNLSQAVEERLPIRIEFEDTETLPLAETLVDDLERRLCGRHRV